MTRLLRAAAGNTGAFYLKNFGIAPGCVAGAFAQSRTFFALPGPGRAALCGTAATADTTASSAGLPPGTNPAT